MIRTACAAVAALLFAAPALAQDESAAAIEAAAPAWATTSNAARLEVLKGQLTAAGLPFEVQTFQGGNARSGPMEGSNVVLTFGEGPKDIVLVAHYDAVPLPGGGFSQGIVDNAGSVLAMMHAALRLRTHDLNHRVIVLLTDQEELGLIGARKWLEGHDKARIAAVVNADVAAYGETIMYGQNNGAPSAFVTRAVQMLCAERAYDCVGFAQYPPSDDRVFTAAGVPVISLGTQDAVGARQMWLAFNGGEDNGLREGFIPPVFQRIHSPQDTLDLLEGQDVGRFAAFLVDLTLALDRGPAA